LIQLLLLLTVAGTNLAEETNKNGIGIIYLMALEVKPVRYLIYSPGLYADTLHRLSRQAPSPTILIILTSRARQAPSPTILIQFTSTARQINHLKSTLPQGNAKQRLKMFIDQIDLLGRIACDAAC
jgi:hypothetical protein